MTDRLTRKDIEAAYGNDQWLGFGYLGERRNAYAAMESSEWSSDTAAVIEDADDAALSVANDKRWTTDRFFEWLNSKDGRWYADATIGSDADFATATRLAEKYVR